MADTLQLLWSGMVATTGYKYVRVEELADTIRSTRHVEPFLYLDFEKGTAIGNEQQLKLYIKMNACMAWEHRVRATTMHRDGFLITSVIAFR